MPAIQMPEPDLQTVLVDIVSASRDQRTPSGGNLQRVNFKGDHYRAEFVTWPMTFDQTRDWAALKSRANTVRVPLDQPELDLGSPGTAVVDGDDQAGANLSVSGMTPFYVIRPDQFFNHVAADGEYRLYRAREQAVVAADGTVTIPLETMLTAPPADGDTVVFADVMIEGFPTVDPASFLKDGNGWQTYSFTIEERG